MSEIEAVVSDFGGVLTSPLLDSFLAFQKASGISPEDLGRALLAVAGRLGLNPVFELEKGKMAEADFLRDLGQELTRQLGRPVEMHSFGEAYFELLAPNPRMIEFMRELRGRGLRMAICTNNVREWEARWRAMLPVDEIFELVVDSAFVGSRKPEPEIYQVTLERLGVDPAATLFIDDVAENCEAARQAGMQAVQFRDTDQAISDIEAALRNSDLS